MRFGHGLGLVMIDIDHFKSVNDTHGHPVGDVVLREVARVVASQVRTVDRVARYGGEEFALILVQTDVANAIDVAQRVCRTVAAQPIMATDTVTLPVTVSAGIAMLPGDARTEAALTAAADKALYAAKRGGRNRAVIFSQI